MKYSFNALATLMATLTGSVVAVGTAKCPATACSQTTIDARALCGWHHRHVALVAGAFTHYEERADESTFFEVSDETPEYRYEDSCGRDPITGEVYGCGRYEPYISPKENRVTKAESPAIHDHVCEHLSLLGTCEITLSNQANQGLECPSVNSTSAVANEEIFFSNNATDADFDDENFDYESTDSWEAEQAANADIDAAEAELAEENTEEYVEGEYDYEHDFQSADANPEPAKHLAGEGNLNPALSLTRWQTNMGDLWLQIQPFWSDAWQQLEKRVARPAPFRKHRVSLAVPIVVLRESVEGDYASAELNAAQEAQQELSNNSAAEQASADYGPLLPSTPAPNQLSYEEEYQRNYALVPYIPEYDNGDDSQAIPADPRAEESLSEPNDAADLNESWDENWENSAEHDDRYTQEYYEGDNHNEGAVRVIQPLWNRVEEVRNSVESDLNLWQTEASEWLLRAQAWAASGNEFLKYAQELAWEQESQQIDEIFNEYCSLINFDNLVIGYQPEPNWETQIVRGLRATGNFLLDCADQIDNESAEKPFFSARQGGKR